MSENSKAFDIRPLVELMCPECEKVGVESHMGMAFRREAGTIAWYIVRLGCPNGHEWIKGAEMRLDGKGARPKKAGE